LEPFVAASSKFDATQPATTGNAEIAEELDDSIGRQAAVSAALVSVFRGNFCDLILPNRIPTTFKKYEVIYNVGDERRTFFFLTGGFVKVGTITANGREVIYDIRRGGDVVGELCVSEPARPDRAVALEQTDAIAVPFEDVLDVLLKNPDMIAVLMNVFCRALKEAYTQVNTLAVEDTIHRLVKILIGLAAKLGRPSGSLVEIPTYLTQEEIAQMVAARRERVSTALNSLRRQGMVQYSARGHLVLNVSALESYCT
jgi:CRP/FNR family transcriptional regulator, cyclic AMP receptor protein